MMSNSNSGASSNSASHAGYGNNQASSSHGMNGKDPFDTWGVNDQKSGRDKSGSGFFTNLFLHAKIQAYEEKLQFLNSSKSDFAGTSVGESDTFFRFLSFRVGGVIFASLLSLIFAMFMFLYLALYVEIFVAYLVFIIISSHSFFPGYIAYKMKRFMIREFTTKFYKKILGVWHAFEMIYVLMIGFVMYLQNFNWLKIGAFFTEKTFTNIIAKKLFPPVIEKIPFEKIPMALEHLSIILLFMLIVYSIAMYLSDKQAQKENDEILFEHDKEQLRPAQLARKKAGKLKI